MAGNPPDRLLFPREVAADLRVSQMTVNRLMHDCEIPATRVGYLWRIYESGYREYLIYTGLSPEIALGMELFGRQWLLTVEEVADRLRVCKMTVYRLIQQIGQLSAIRIRNKNHSIYRFPEFEYDAYLRNKDRTGRPSCSQLLLPVAVTTFSTASRAHLRRAEPDGQDVNRERRAQPIAGR